MRFFSNEAKENPDEVRDADNDRERAQAEGLPTPVPQQRVGSPWSDTPGSGSETAEEAVEPQAYDDRDAGESLRRDDSEVRHDGDDLVRDSDSPRHDDVDLPLDDHDRTDDHAGTHRADTGDASGTAPVDTAATDTASDDTASDDTASDDTASDGTARVDTASASADSADADAAAVDEVPGGEQRAGTTTTYGPDGSVTTVDSADAAATDERRDGDGDLDSDRDLDGDGDLDRHDDRDLDEAAPVVATAPVETAAPGSGTVSETSDGESAPAAAAPAVPVGAADEATGSKPDPTASPVGDKLFTDGDSFNERLRDIALNFVDNPKEATAQAGALVDEAIDKVTSALKSQKDALAGEGDDTERLRVELRGYRDILKRISSL